jgi:UDP-N-acetylmuramoyl-tripeptide--D-alanyl-D-alanine ligase
VTAAGVLSVGDVVTATGGRLVAGALERAVTGVSIDSRTLSGGELFVAIVGPRFDGHEFIAAAAQAGASAALVSADVEAPSGIDLIRVDDTTQGLAALARFVRRRTTVPIVAITGSMGKTTTKEMTARLLETAGPVLRTQGNLNNQYGLPLMLLRLRPEHRFAVLELGMSAAGELRHLSGIAEPDVAVITNVAPVHLEFFSSVDAIAAAKAEILEGLRPGGLAVLNGDDPRVRAIGERQLAERRREVAWFGHDRAYAVSAENWRGTAHGMRFDLVAGGLIQDIALPLSGPHFVMNFLAATAVAVRLGIDLRVVADAALNLRPAAHRGEVVRLSEQVTLLDDSYNSNPVAAEAAVASLGMAGGRRRVAFLGDMLELGPRGRDLHVETGRNIGARVDVLVGVGPLAPGLLEGAREAGIRPGDLHYFADSTQAASAAATIVQPGDAVLVKGSRGIHMEAVVEAITGRFGAAGETH